MLHPSFPFLSSTLLSTALKGAAAEGSLDGSLQTHWRHLVRQSSTCLCSLCFCNGCPTHLLTDSVFCRVSIFNQCYGSKRYWRSADIYEQKLTIYITLQMLYTVNMLNRFNAISLSILQSISVFFYYFLASEPMSTCRPGQARWMYKQLFAFFILITGSHFKQLFVKALPSNMFLTLSLRKGEH